MSAIDPLRTVAFKAHRCSTGNAHMMQCVGKLVKHKPVEKPERRHALFMSGGAVWRLINGAGTSCES